MRPHRVRAVHWDRRSMRPAGAHQRQAVPKHPQGLQQVRPTLQLAGRPEEVGLLRPRLGSGPEALRPMHCLVRPAAVARRRARGPQRA